MVALKELRLKCGQRCGLETQLLDLDAPINGEKIHEHVIQDDISSENTEVEVMRNEILMIHNLDDTISEFNDKMKKSTEETLFCQYENRKRLSNILLSSSPETGRLVENTKEFFQLCPRYMMLIAETNKDSNASKGNSRNLVQQDKLIDLNTKLPSIMEVEKFTSNSEVVSNKTKNSESNPYTLDTEMKKILSELEESACGLWKNLSNDWEHSVNDHVSCKSTEISQLDTVSTIKSLKDIDIEVVNEIIKEAQITTPLSILTNVANDL